MSITSARAATGVRVALSAIVVLSAVAALIRFPLPAPAILSLAGLGVVAGALCVPRIRPLSAVAILLVIFASRPIARQFGGAGALAQIEWQPILIVAAAMLSVYVLATVTKSDSRGTLPDI